MREGRAPLPPALALAVALALALALACPCRAVTRALDWCSTTLHRAPEWNVGVGFEDFGGLCLGLGLGFPPWLWTPKHQTRKF